MKRPIDPQPLVDPRLKPFLDILAEFLAAAVLNAVQKKRDDEDADHPGEKAA